MFKKPKRVPRKVGRDDDEPQIIAQELAQDGKSKSREQIPYLIDIQRRWLIQAFADAPTVIKRPTKSKASKAAAKSAAARTTFTDDEIASHESTAIQDNKEDPFAAVERKRTIGSTQKSRLSSDSFAHRPSHQEAQDAPRYTSDYLAALKAEQLTAPPPSAQLVPEDELPPSPPQPPQDGDDGLEGIGFIDTTPSYAHATFVHQPTPSTDVIVPGNETHIPTATEIAEKKARRARLAAEEKADAYIKLSDDDADSSSEDDRPRDSLIVPASEVRKTDKYGHDKSRIGQYELDDDNFAEGFDEFVDDPARIQTVTGKETESAARKKRREEIQRHLGDDEGAEDEEDADEAARMRDYDAAQLRHATYINRSTTHGQAERQKQQDREREEKWRREKEMRYIVRPVPRMGDAVRNLKAKVESVRAEREALEKKIEGVRKEREVIKEDEERVKVLLKEAGEKLERVMGAKKGENETEKRGEEEVKEQEGEQHNTEGVTHMDVEKQQQEQDTQATPPNDEDVLLEDDTARPGLGAPQGGGQVFSGFTITGDAPVTLGTHYIGKNEEVGNEGEAAGGPFVLGNRIARDREENEDEGGSRSGLGTRAGVGAAPTSASRDDDDEAADDEDEKDSRPGLGARAGLGARWDR